MMKNKIVLTGVRSASFGGLSYLRLKLFLLLWRSQNHQQNSPQIYHLCILSWLWPDLARMPHPSLLLRFRQNYSEFNGLLRRCVHFKCALPGPDLDYHSRNFYIGQYRTTESRNTCDPKNAGHGYRTTLRSLIVHNIDLQYFVYCLNYLLLRLKWVFNAEKEQQNRKR